MGKDCSLGLEASSTGGETWRPQTIRLLSVCHSAGKQDPRTETEFMEGQGTVDQMLAVK